jgi:hypothetical protein
MCPVDQDIASDEVSDLGVHRQDRGITDQHERDSSKLRCLSAHGIVLLTRFPVLTPGGAAVRTRGAIVTGHATAAVASMQMIERSIRMP